jgi:hypothetical protein
MIKVFGIEPHDTQFEGQYAGGEIDLRNVAARHNFCRDVVGRVRAVVGVLGVGMCGWEGWLGLGASSSLDMP